MNIITTWNLKGGTGKTTTSFNLAATYAAQDRLEVAYEETYRR